MINIDNFKIGAKIFVNSFRTLPEGRGKSNCIGTALYLAGAVPEDCYLDPKTDYEKICGLIQRVDSPVVGGLISFEQDRTNEDNTGYIAHMGVIIGINPLRVIHREYPKGPVIRNECFENKRLGGSRVYYTLRNSS